MMSSRTFASLLLLCLIGAAAGVDLEAPLRTLEDDRASPDFKALVDAAILKEYGVSISSDCKDCIESGAVTQVKTQFKAMEAACKVAITDKQKKECHKLEQHPDLVVIDMLRVENLNPITTNWKQCHARGICEDDENVAAVI